MTGPPPPATDLSRFTHHASLVRWQHHAGSFWPYVCAAPFLGNAIGSSTKPSLRAGLPRELAHAIASLPKGSGIAVYVDLPLARTLPAAPALNRLGFVVVPIIGRWSEDSAVLPCADLLRLLVRFGRLARRPSVTRGVVFLLDGERAGPTGLRMTGRRRFDNRYEYSVDRFPTAEFLKEQGITETVWVGTRFTAGGDPTPTPPPPPKEGDQSKTLAGVPAPASYRRFVRRAQVRGLLADHLVRGEPYLAMNALVLEPRDDARLRELTEIFSTVFDRAARIVATNVPLLEEMGFPWVAAELLSAEIVRTPLVGRFDFVRDVTGHWWLLEFNADTPSGIREAIAVEHELCALRDDAGLLLRPSVDLGSRLVAAFIDSLGMASSGAAGGADPTDKRKVLGLVTNASELEDLAQMAFTRDLLREPLAARGIDVVLGDIDNLRATRDGVSLCGRHIDALYRYVPFETTFGTPAFAAIYDAIIRKKLLLLNGLFGLLLQHKGLLAWIWSHRADPIFNAAEQAAIANHLPETVTIRDYLVATPWPSFHGLPSPSTKKPEPRERCLNPVQAADTPHPALASSHPAARTPNQPVVVKQVFGREGEEVFFGDELDDLDWARLRRDGTYVVQVRVAVEAIDAVVPTALGARLATGSATVGGYAVAGAWAGYYTRFGGTIITSRAKWLATLVRR